MLNRSRVACRTGHRHGTIQPLHSHGASCCAARAWALEWLVSQGCWPPRTTGLGLGSHGALARGVLDPMAPRPPQFAAKAKQVVHLFMNGGPSHVDTFDPKPMLKKYHGKTLPGPTLRTERKTGAALGSPFAFKKYGESGLEVSELFARTAGEPCRSTCASSVRCTPTCPTTSRRSC